MKYTLIVPGYRWEGDRVYGPDDLLNMAKAMVELARAGKIRPEQGEPFWGYWDTHLDVRTGYTTPDVEGREYRDGEYIVRLICTAAFSCPSGPCGEEWALVVWGPDRTNGAPDAPDGWWVIHSDDKVREKLLAPPDEFEKLLNKEE